jgi:hypothetical protein
MKLTLTEPGYYRYFGPESKLDGAPLTNADHFFVQPGKSVEIEAPSIFNVARPGIDGISKLIAVREGPFLPLLPLL